MPDERRMSLVDVVDFHLQTLIDLAPKDSLALLRPMSPGRVPGTLSVEADRLRWFLEEFRDDEHLIELSDGSYTEAMKALTDKGYSEDIDWWPPKPE